MLKNLAIGVRLLFIVAVATLGMLMLGVIGLLNLKHELLSDREDALKNLVQSAYSSFDDYADQARRGDLAPEVAQQRALAALRHMRFDQTNYFFVIDLDAGSIVMHPTNPQLEGKNVLKMTDPAGKPLFAEMIKVAREQGDGFVSYLWPKPGARDPRPKLSYVLRFPDRPWAIGAGIYIDDVDEAFWSRGRELGLIGLSLVLVVAGGAVLIGRGITRPLTAITGRMDGLAHGDLHVDVPYTDQRDEVGALARALQVFKDNAVRMEGMRRAQDEAEARTRAERRQALLEMAGQLEAATGHIVGALTKACHDMEGTAQGMSSLAEQTSRQTVAVAVGSEEASANVQTVAAATNQLSSSVEEISRQLAQATQICGQAVARAASANQQVQQLTDAAARIGDVVRLITAIAEQTNLLALNATIEAARAGEAGKGFAVVAGEVKALATQTAKATEDITSQVSTMQEVTTGTATAIGEIGGVIDQVNQISSVIASAVEEQGAATREIARNIEQAAAGTSEVTENIVGVKEAARETGESADRVLTVAKDLADLADQLHREVECFLGRIRAG